MERHELVYGRLLSDFVVGETWEHPWELTLDAGLAAVWAASFADPTPLYSSTVQARALGFADRPLHPLLCLNLALSFSVHDVSEQAIAHLAYLDVRFPAVARAGDTVRARSTVLEVKEASSGERGVVHVRTELRTHEGAVVCAFERKALVRAGRLAGRPAAAREIASSSSAPMASHARLPPELRALRPGSLPSPALHGAFEDFHAGQVYAHAIGRTVGESEHMQLTTLVRNSHPLHFDEVYCRDNSFTGRRVVYGGLVLAWVAALAARDLGGHALWDLGWDEGAHPAAVSAGDTLYAASQVLRTDDSSEIPGLAGGAAGSVTMRLVGLANLRPSDAIDRYGERLFEPELGRKEGRIPEKVLEIKRTLLVTKRG